MADELHDDVGTTFAEDLDGHRGVVEREPSSLISRDAELERLRGFLAESGQARCLVLVGETGIGKTALWEEGLALARARGYAVLSARGSPAESTLAFAALGDLMERIGRGALDAVPAPQLHALEVALRLADPGGGPPDQLAISAGFLNALRAVAERQQVLIALDDVQWLDKSSEKPIVFAARRLLGGRGRVLLSRRLGEDSTFERVLRSEGVEHLELTGLSIGAVSRLLRDRLDLRLSRSDLRKLYDTCKGNPLFAIELGRMMVGAERRDTGAELPVPRLVEDVFGERVRQLSSSLRQVLLAMALSARLKKSELSALVDPLAVEDAVGSGLLVVDGTRVRPSHPLFAVAVRQHSRAIERRELHLGLASVVDDPTLSARHLAMATSSADTETAAKVAAAADIAVETGAVLEAEELAAHALRLTPLGSPERGDRLLVLARRHLDAAEWPRAESLLKTHMAELQAGRQRGLAYLLLAEATHTGDHELELALVEAGDDREVRAKALFLRAFGQAVTSVSRLDEAEDMAREALALAKMVGPELEAEVAPALAWALVLRGVPLDERREPALASWLGSGRYLNHYERAEGVRRAFRGELVEARSIFSRLFEDAQQRGELRMSYWITIQRTELAVRAGDASEARRLIEELRESSLAEQSGAFTRLVALTEAIEGRSSVATGSAEATLGNKSEPVGWNKLEASRARGLTSLFDGDAASAVESLYLVWDHCQREHVGDPGAFPVAGDLVEALVQLGDLDRACTITEGLTQAGLEQEHPWALATVRRCNALIGLAERYEAGSADELRAAAHEHAGLGTNFDRARCLLALGRVERGEKKYGDARRSLEEAAAVFEQGGCSGWAELARAELARVGGRRGAGENELTPSERQVVHLAVQGLSNKEIAGRLFVSVSTVEVHLSHAYAKLGVRSRVQLSQALDQE